LAPNSVSGGSAKFHVPAPGTVTEAPASRRADGWVRYDVAAPDAGWDPLWGRVSDFLTWVRNMQRMLRAGEFEPFADRAKTITFDFW